MNTGVLVRSTDHSSRWYVNIANYKAKMASVNWILLFHGSFPHFISSRFALSRERSTQGIMPAKLARRAAYVLIRMWIQLSSTCYCHCRGPHFIMPHISLFEAFWWVSGLCRFYKHLTQKGRSHILGQVAQIMINQNTCEWKSDFPYKKCAKNAVPCFRVRSKSRAS